MLLPMGRMRPSQLDAMLTAQTPEGVTKAFAETPRGRRLLREEIPREGGEKGLHDPDMLPSLEKFRQCRHHIRYSVHPPVVMLSYIFLTETEIDNLISIIEGIRYQVPADGIRNLLIYSD